MGEVFDDRGSFSEGEYNVSRRLLQEDTEKGFSDENFERPRCQKRSQLKIRLSQVVFTIARHGFVTGLLLSLLVLFYPSTLIQMIRKFSIDPSVVPLKHCKLIIPTTCSALI
jgi:hypothetical protein